VAGGRFCYRAVCGCRRVAGSARVLGANEKLNIAIIGVGGRGGGNLGSVSSENIVALCDVYEPPVLKAAERFPERGSTGTSGGCLTTPTRSTRWW